jgi:hypothetical protein
MNIIIIFINIIYKYFKKKCLLLILLINIKNVNLIYFLIDNEIILFNNWIILKNVFLYKFY